MIPTTLNNSNNATQTVTSATIGIASLILEGRALSDDDYVIPVNGKKHVLLMPPGYNSTTMQQNHVPLINITTNPTAELPLPPKLAATLTTAAALEAAVTAVVVSNSRPPHPLSSPPLASSLSPSPLSTKAAASVSGSSSTSSSLASSFQSASSTLSGNAISLTTSDPSIQHFQRIRQKLTQLRQSSPRSSRDPFSAAEHKIVVGGPSNLHHNVASGAPEISADNSSSGDDFDNEFFQSSSHATIQRKLSGNSAPVWGTGINFGSGNGGGGTSLMSASNNCNSTNFGGNSTAVSGGNISPKFGNSSSPTTLNNHLPDNNLLHTLQSLATNCLWASPRSLGRATEDWDYNATGVSSGSSTTGARVAFNSTSNKNYLINHSLSNINSGFKLNNNTSNNINTNNSSSSTQSKKEEKISASPKQGPHCDQFLKKIGLNGNNVQQQTEFEEHICDMANLNEICFNWQVHCRQLEVMLSRSDPICIEVYLGPENHEILLEQWIVEKTDTPTIPSMTIQALCNAIRSQLYFSQITAWSDLIKKLNPFDKEIVENARIKSFNTLIGKSMPSSSLGSASSTSSNLSTIKKPRLNIFYRIKPYDSTASFNAKPNIHNFPNVLISGNCAISVCLKSLPRLQGGIPKITEINKMISTKPTASTMSSNNLSGHESVTPNPGTSNTSAQECPMLLDDSLDIPCTEKGKHKCTYDEEDGGSSDAIGECSGNSSSGGSTENGDCGNSMNLSHRERQLMKYRKRMMKRDKKKKFTSNNCMIQEHVNYSHGKSSTASAVKQNNAKNEFDGNERKNQDENKLSNLHFSDGKAQIEEIHMLQQQQEFGSINSIGLPLYQTITKSIANSVQTQPIEMISIGTQTADFLMIPCCDKCGSEMSAICFNCNKSENKKPLLELNTYYKNCQEKKKSPERKLGKGELLLQAIQRAPKNKSQDARNNNNSFSLLRPTSFLKNSCNGTFADEASTLPTNDCQLCKRQKTQHNYKQKDNQNKNISFFNNNNINIFKSGCNQQQSNNLQLQQKNLTSATKSSSENNCNCSSACLTVRMDDYEIDNAEIAATSTLLTPPSSIDAKCLNCNSSKSSLIYQNGNSQYETPKLEQVQLQQHTQKNENTKTATLLQINCDIKENGLKITKALPKINLTNVFCGNNHQLTPTVSTSSFSSSPIPIVQQNTLVNSPDSVASDISINSINTLEIPVQKSNSAPTLPNSSSLSPRFIKQAAIYKRRSRHLSDRSDRSSLGSDDLSDEDLDSLYPSPTSSPLKSKFFTKLSAFARRPLLGNLEESLFQKRFLPKMNVAGFKVLLGASGQFCPTQLTIPAASYFYELEGETLSTPYVCEIRLSRKGYTIPRFGTVQATLLNPFGTVVRMFVIPYDFRDMPPMNQTFIRQRILAVDSDTLSTDESFSNNHNNNNYNINNNNNFNDNISNNKNNNNLNKINLNNNSSNNVDNSVPHCSKEHLRSLRYSIHLRFQTSRSGRLALHTDIRFLISRRTDCDTAAAHAKGALESPNELRIVTVTPDKPKYSARQEPQNCNKI